MNVPAPFPAFGGKSAVADLVWQRLGFIRNYVAPSYDGRAEFDMVYEEPFANSAAIMLRNPAYDWENGRWVTVVYLKSVEAAVLTHHRMRRRVQVIGDTAAGELALGAVAHFHFTSNGVGSCRTRKNSSVQHSLHKSRPRT